MLPSRPTRSCPAPFAPLMFVALIGLAGCGSDVSRTFGLSRDAPDEFVVTTRAPLSMPPNYMLEPPRPGAPRPQEMDSRTGAEAALVPESALASGAAGSSAGQQALVQAAGPAAPADIRARVDQQAAMDAPKPGLTDKLLFWMTTPQPGVTVDPQKEAQRIRENSALGQSQAQGETAIIQPKSHNIFSDIF